MVTEIGYSALGISAADARLRVTADARPGVKSIVLFVQRDRLPLLFEQPKPRGQPCFGRPVFPEVVKLRNAEHDNANAQKPQENTSSRQVVALRGQTAHCHLVLDDLHHGHPLAIQERHDLALEK